MRLAVDTVLTIHPARLVPGVVVALALALPARSAAAQVDDDPSGQWFALPVDREAARLSVEALDHLDAQRWELAIDALMDLVDGRPENLLPDGWATDLERPSQMAHHLGAAEWARGTLANLPRAALEIYALRFGPKADEAVAHALRDGSTEELRAVADHYPVAPAAARALRAGGDLAFAAGQLSEASLLWDRASLLERRLGIHDAQAAQVRVDALEAVATTAEFGPPDSGFTLPGPGQAPGPVPRGERETWSADVPDNPFAFGASRSDYPNLVPVVHGDRVYLSTTLNVLCLDAFDGTELWRSPEPPGWAQLGSDDRESLEKAIDKENQVVVPAVGSGVVVAAQQIPYAALPNDDYQSFVIMRALPDRRLFAFDSETGRLLWRHLPPPAWDGLTGSFSERMSVAGAPIVAGSRVIAPMFRMEGRVDLQVAAFDLHSGDLLWSTPVISGQRELNMFNRHEREYSAPPVRVEGDLVLVATQLGTVAALDLFNGAVRWQATYDQIPLPPTRGLISSDRRLTWKNSPPVVSEGVVLVTPLDSEDLIAVDIDQGSVLWSQPASSLRPARQSDSEVDALIGAGEREVYFSGGWVAAWRKAEGLRARAQLAPGSLRVELDPGPTTYSSAQRAPRALVAEGMVLVPGSTELRAYDLRDGSEVDGVGFPWEKGERGNLAVGPGLLVSANNKTITGFLDLAVLESRAAARLAAAPGDDGAALELARLLNRRARSQIALGHASDSLALLERARATLQDRIEGAAAPLVSELVANLQLEADLRRTLGQPEPARDLLERGLEIARAPGQVRDLLLALLPVVRTYDVDAWLAALEDLRRRCGDLDIGIEHLIGDPEWIEFARVDGVWALPVPAGGWALAKRALWSQERGHFAEALEDWHAVLAGYRNEHVSADVTLGERSVARIADLLAAGGPHLYEPFEARARTLLDEALSRGDGDALDRLPQLFPFAEATLEARRERLSLALDQGDVRALAEAVGALTADLDPRLDELARGALLARLAIGLGRSGNRDFERALLTRLAGTLPDLQLQDEPFAGQRLDEVVARFPANVPQPRPTASFDQQIMLGDELPGPWHMLGQPPVGANSAGGEVPRPLIVVSGGELQAFDVDQPDKPLWTGRPPLDELPVEQEQRWVLTPSRVVVGSDGLLVAIDVSSGRAAWIHAIGRGELRAVTATDGVVIAQVFDLIDRTHQLMGIDAIGGDVLWTTPLPSGPGWFSPLAANGHVVAIAYETVGPADACVLDAFTGELRGQIQLPDKLGSWIDRAPWITGDRLVLPSLLRGRVAAIDLERLDEAWSIELGDDRDLRAVLTHAGRMFLVAEGNGLGEGGRRGAIIEVDPRLGSRRTVYSLDREDRVIGVRRGDRIELPIPMVFTVSSPRSDERAQVTAIDLDRGRQWVQELAVTETMLYDPSWARAVVSETTVALFYAQRARRNGTRERVWLDLLSRPDGTRLGRRFVPSEYEAFQSLTPLASGSTLWLGCKSPRGTMDRIDLWRNER
ncbi:PQQ-binding-like beta-propeller repeat protein [Engelhardtia mirabilis]|uniref:Outer membrane biogenesis protein BamB n=1 Tax=Engelhardtia mirabilis TaxID=2528011 RepID=A0A518BMM2_9BACT|nr:outer membrane biogenesis protein BamB [Planctomycetes bacterium Pla133]QDV02557.1 outer membrane biogenesis protein BamB [Planctomycetes bacterium Pla86]